MNIMKHSNLIIILAQCSSFEVASSALQAPIATWKSRIQHACLQRLKGWNFPRKSKTERKYLYCIYVENVCLSII